MPPLARAASCCHASRTLECLRLSGDHYDVDAAGAQDQTLEPPSFPGLKIPLREVWES